MRVVALINNLVPYHHARWSAWPGRNEGDVTLLEMTRRDEFAVLELPASSSLPYHRHTLFPNRRQDCARPRRIRRPLVAALDRIRPELVCLNGYSLFYNWAALAWCCQNNVPTVICSESNQFDQPRRPWFEALKGAFLKFCSSALVGGTPQRDYLEGLGVPRENIFLGYDVVDNEHFATGADSARARAVSLRQAGKLPRRFFLACSRFAPRKNLATLLEAFARYRAEGANAPDAWSLVIVGDGALRDELETQVGALGLMEHVLMPGAIAYAELPVYYGLAGAFVHASTVEQWGLVVNEAMAAGLPVLVSKRCGCVRDLVQAGINGWTFNPGAPAELAGLMRRIAGNDVKPEGMGEASRRIIADWGPARFAQGLEAAIGCAVRCRHKPRSRGALRLLSCVTRLRILANR